MSEKVPKKSLKCAQTGKNSVQEKSSHPISSPISCSDPQFHNITPSFGNFMDNQKQGAKSGQGMGQGMGLGRTLQMTLLIQMTVIYN
jgi:hypothetical protein